MITPPISGMYAVCIPHGDYKSPLFYLKVSVLHYRTKLMNTCVLCRQICNAYLSCLPFSMAHRACAPGMPDICRTFAEVPLLPFPIYGPRQFSICKPKSAMHCSARPYNMHMQATFHLLKPARIAAVFDKSKQCINESKERTLPTQIRSRLAVFSVAFLVLYALNQLPWRHYHTC